MDPSSRALKAVVKAQLIAVVVREASRRQLTLEGKVVRGDGQASTGGSLALVERTSTGIEGLDKLIATFDPAGLAPGDYVLQVAIEDTTNGKRELSSLSFTVR